MIEVTNVTKRYGTHTAVDDVSFRVEAGEVVGFLGPNGAGKSTTMNIITGFLSATDGTVTVDGIDVLEDPIGAKRTLGYLPELPPLYVEMTVRDYLRFVARVKGVDRADRDDANDEIMRSVGIEHVADRMIRNLSKGYRQRVGLGQALVGDPKALILDEPTIGLDPHQIIEMRDLVRTLGEKRTVILSSHILPEVSAVCERIIIISHGKIVASDTAENLGKALAGSGRFSVRIKGTADAAQAALRDVSGVESARVTGQSEAVGTVDLEVDTGEADPREAIFYALADARLPLFGMRSLEVTLEEIFLQLTDDDSEQEAS
ncbi:MAG: ATP-binding cassette domain-containing protein [Spirochaetaceae bacterium]|nr:ATP-binding cassette domain-containing protein [Spirochaetaceae bacterium]